MILLLGLLASIGVVLVNLLFRDFGLKTLFTVGDIMVFALVAWVVGFRIC